ncbi:ankyrin repeat domain-containing protein [Leptospira sp. 'Mane']|uniref:ankyrin repeat domain-containing protein n=1 Tax=Leptospira sp. 'Mane' TaxID=3387407 RepID=UPI00398A8045
MFPLHIAVESGKKESVLILLQHGANPDVADPNQVTPLHIANSYDGLGEISDLLLKYGANPDRRDNLGKRYLM